MKKKLLFINILLLLFSCKDISVEKDNPIIDSKENIDTYYNSFITESLVERLNSIDKTIEKYYDSLELENSTNFFYDLSIKFQDSVLYYSRYNDSISNIILPEREKIEFQSLQKLLIQNKRKSIQDFNNMKSLLYPYSVKVGYYENETIENYLLMMYLKNDVKELIEDFMEM